MIVDVSERKGQFDARQGGVIRWEDSGKLYSGFFGSRFPIVKSLVLVVYLYDISAR